MNGGSWVSLIAVAGALVLVGSALHARRIGASRMAIMVLGWAAIFVLTAAVFSAASR